MSPRQRRRLLRVLRRRDFVIDLLCWMITVYVFAVLVVAGCSYGGDQAAAQVARFLANPTGRLAMLIEGLTPEEAIRLCTSRHNEIRGEELKFLMRLRVDEPLQPRQVVRLTAIVRRLRQGDLVAELTRGPVSGE